jgi:membrane-associated phospholipid phosphatase
MCVRIFPSFAIFFITIFLSAINSFGQAVQLPPDQCGLHALKRCAAEIAKDQAGILTSPLRIHKKDFVWLVPFAAATSAAFIFDRRALEQVSTNPSRVQDFRSASNFTGIYMPLAATGASWLTGVVKHNDHLRETGFLAAEAMADTALFTTMFKYATNRVRPLAARLSDESGEFWPDGKHYPGADSFPSGHTAVAFAFAHVIANEYPGWKIKLAVYGLAAATAFERVAGREHFPSDVLVGGGIGYLIGGYVYRHHHAGSSGKGISFRFSPMIGANAMGVSLAVSR